MQRLGSQVVWSPPSVTTVLLAMVLTGCSIDAPSGPTQGSSHVLSHAVAGVIASSWAYDASLGTLPESQGFGYFTGGGNPAPVVSGGALISDATTNWEVWNRASGVDFSQDFVSETVIRVDSSNYIPSSPASRSWEGYYILSGDGAGQSFDVGLASGGYTINSLSLLNQPLHPLTLTDGRFHTFRVAVHAGLGSLTYDDSVLVSGVPTTSLADPFVSFGPASTPSRSLTALKSFCFGTSPTDCLADLSLAMVPPVPTFNLNQNTVVTFRESNAGTRPSTAATMQVAATPGFRVVGSSGTTCSPAAGGLACTLGPVASGGQQTFTLTVKPVQRGTFPVLLTLKGQETDGNKTNNVISRNVIVH